jgi:uncharacterized membrane protein HdeD (DUF308 family)
MKDGTLTVRGRVVVRGEGRPRGSSMRATPSATPWISASIADSAEQLRRMQRWLTIAGVLSLLAGIVAIVLPNIASIATAIFVGWLLLLVAALYVVEAFSTRDQTRTAVRLLLAVLTFAAGVYLLVAPLDGTFTLTVILVIWFVAIGIARLVIGVTDYGTFEGTMLTVSGALALGLGLLIAMRLPDAASWAIGLVVGVDFIFTGALMIGLARALRVRAR